MRRSVRPPTAGLVHDKRPHRENMLDCLPNRLYDVAAPAADNDDDVR